MPSIELVLTTLSIGTGFAWLVVAVATVRGLRDLRQLEPLDAPPAGRVHVIVPSRDDTADLQHTLPALLAQQAVDLQITVVDDRSETPLEAELPEALRSDGRIDVARVDTLPDGWLGKPHACTVAARRTAADRDWLLFLDADSRLAPDAVARGLRVAEREDADHVSLIPQLRDQTLAGRAVALSMCVGLVRQSAGIERDVPDTYMAVGAFLLVRREAYEQIGGHASAPLAVVEDVDLARRIRQAKFRSRLRFATDEFSVAWITTLGSVFTVLEKNYFAMFGFRLVPFLAVVVLGLGAWLSAWLCLVLGLATNTAGPVLFAAPIGLGALAVSTVGIARRYGWSPLFACAVPLSLGTVFAAMLHSMRTTLARGGVQWRGTLHPLAELRAAADRSRRATQRNGPDV